MQSHTKFFLQSKTVLAGVATLVISLAGGLSVPFLDNLKNQEVYDALEKGLSDRQIGLIESKYENYKTAVATACLILTGSGGAIAVQGRIDAKNRLHTPSWLPGENKTDGT